MSSLQPSLKRLRFPLSPIELALLGLTVLISAVSAWCIQRIGLTTSLTDASAHLDFSKFLSQSLTPGISQIGFWPPLLQLVMAPWTAVPYLFKTGLAGYFAILPFFCLGVIALYRLVRSMTNSQALGVTAALLLLLNPYAIYYASVPMMEMLYASNLLVASYALLRWLQSHEIRHIIWLGFFVALASMSRYEGLLLVPLVGLILLLDLFRTRTNRSQIEATLLMFGMIALVGAIFIMTFSWVFGGSPLAFQDTTWIRDPQSNLNITKFHPLVTLKYLASGAYYMVGRPMTWLALGAVLPALIKREGRFERIAILVCLISPLLFVAATLMTGRDSVLTPNLYPFKFFHNDRYTLTWIGFVITAPMLLLGDLMDFGRRFRFVRPVAIGFASLLLASLVTFSGYRTYLVAYANQYPAIRSNINGALDVQRPDLLSVGDYLKNHYDFGYVLMLRSNEDPIIQSAGIPLDRYIYEANYKYYDQALTDPSIFARWVVTTNTDDAFSAANDKVSATLLKNGKLSRFYTLVYKTDSRQVYQINQTAALQESIFRGYNPLLIPSLTGTTTAWNPATVYTALVETTNKTKLSEDRLALSAALQSAYNNQLKVQFEKGPYVDANQKGSSENQAYALEEALAADDPATFAKVWSWTKVNLQRPDKLISYQFNLQSDGSAVITDTYSVSSADTDIADTLLKAGTDWKESAYTQAGMQIVQAIWTGDTEYDATGNRHVLAGNWGRLTKGFITNAQAIDPAAFHQFAIVDPAHNWNAVAKQAYVDLTAISQPDFTGHQQFLPVNWAVINPTTGSYSAYEAEKGYNDVTYGSMRAVWYVAQDAKRFASPDARAYLLKLTTYKVGIDNGKLCTVYAYTPPTHCYVDLASLAAPVSALQVTDPILAQRIVANYGLQRENLTMPTNADFFQQSWYWLTLNGWSKR